MTLRDAAVISPESAAPGYMGPSSDTIVDKDDPTRFFTVQYYADQIASFQATLIQLDQTAQVLANDVLPQLDSAQDADSIAQIQAWLADYQAKKTEIQLAAKAINTVVTTANAFGVGLPQIRLPTTLAIVPAVAIAGAVAAVAAAAAIIAWAAEKIATAQQFTQQLASLPADVRAAALDKMTATNTGVLAQLGDVIKWVAIGALVWFGYKAFTEERGRAAALL
jgi:hypothetical protein